ncbi:expressed unknown protein [Seminavis robusta]|uniref:Uncharacterized protein n=1 Tax=Seminavis robusta TaxID=568900 RepID=A0A9N8HSV8_9STRA|nr:expressed unknown protein [Seminavis robusta]|eukprot:Sro1205_g252250.1 n/a (331) ;mRNA; f:4231-5366
MKISVSLIVMMMIGLVAMPCAAMGKPVAIGGESNHTDAFGKGGVSFGGISGAVGVVVDRSDPIIKHLVGEVTVNGRPVDEEFLHDIAMMRGILDVCQTTADSLDPVYECVLRVSGNLMEGKDAMERLVIASKMLVAEYEVAMQNDEAKTKSTVLQTLLQYKKSKVSDALYETTSSKLCALKCNVKFSEHFKKLLDSRLALYLGTIPLLPCDWQLVDQFKATTNRLGDNHEATMERVYGLIDSAEKQVQEGYEAAIEALERRVQEGKAYGEQLKQKIKILEQLEGCLKGESSCYVDAADVLEVFDDEPGKAESYLQAFEEARTESSEQSMD